MNTKNNSRKRESQRRIREALAAELEERGALERVTVSALCTRAGVNRSTFYASYHDVFDLADKTCDDLSAQIDALAREEHEVVEGANPRDLLHLRLLQHIYENQDLYRMCFRLGIGRRPIVRWGERGPAEPTREDARTVASVPGPAVPGAEPGTVDYHLEFFRAGFNAVVQLWLERGCPESPEHMAGVIRDEYRGRTVE